MSAFPQGDQWKDPAFVEAWKKNRRDSLTQTWKQRLLEEPFRRSPLEDARESIQGEHESFTSRARRLETGAKPFRGSGKTSDQARHQVPRMILWDGLKDVYNLHPAVRNATPGKLAKSKRMCRLGLEKKAQREIACGLLGGIQSCLDNGHQFFRRYECGNRYCVKCGPKHVNKLFARQHDRLLFVAQSLMLCGEENCMECNHAIAEKRLPHANASPCLFKLHNAPMRILRCDRA